MQDPLTADEKEKRRKKQSKRMGKILGRVWELDNDTKCFQDRPAEFQASKDDGVVLCLSDIGQKIDANAYRLGRHGWEDFAKDLGGVYNFHISSTRRSKSAPLAKKYLDQVIELLGSIDKSLVKLAAEYIPKEPSLSATSKKASNATASDHKTTNNKKRTTSESSHANNGTNNKKAKHSNKNRELAEREERAMDQLYSFIEDLGANRGIVSGYRSRVTKKQSSNARKYDIVFFNESGRRFRSMLEVGRFLKIVKDSAGVAGGRNFRRRKGLGKPTSKELDNEKKRIRKELERLRKAQTKATKSLDEFMTSRSESNFPVDDHILLEEEKETFTTASTSHAKLNSNICNGDTNSTNGNSCAIISEKLDNNNIGHGNALIFANSACAGACVTDIDGFPGIPDHCTPDVLMTWDFLSTFERVLSLSPIALDDFASALVYVPPVGQTGDDVLVPPVYIAEAHLSLLKLLLQDRSSDDWWWSTLESDDAEKRQEAEFDETDDADKNDESRPVIKMDMELALGESEDPVVTTSWMRALEHIGEEDGKDGKALKSAIKTALKVVSNKWIAAYLRKVLDVYKSLGLKLAKKAVRWLVYTVLEARPDLGDRVVHKETVTKAKSKVVLATKKQMESLAASAPAVADEEVISDFEYDDESEDEFDDDDSEHQQKSHDGAAQDDSKNPASAIPPKPLPSIVDLLLPPAKPKHNSEFVDAFTWSHVVGVAAARYLHRKKRLLNEIDDNIRASHVLRPLTGSERREREKLVASRILTECCDSREFPSPLEKAIEHLCSGGNYLDLSPVERLCVFRLLIEANYDAGRVFEAVSDNYKQRTNALKSLDLEQRRAKKEAKEKLAADEAAAREQLALEARERFLDEKREEIKELNSKSKEFPEDVIESFTDEDIIDFDEDIRADYDALPGPETFNKTEVAVMIKKMQEQAAFDTDALRVLTLTDLIEREKVELEEMEGQLAGFGGDAALEDPDLDKETRRSVERLQRDIDKARIQFEKLPAVREKAMEQLVDAIENGTIKVLRSAFTAAKKARLCGTDDETGGVWAVDLMRDVALELEIAKQNKRLSDAQRDLHAKLKKCFIRTEPIGRDRFGNRFWSFDSDESGHTWVEAEFSASGTANGLSAKQPSRFLDLSRVLDEVAIGAKDLEEDFIVGGSETVSFPYFSRREYHSSGSVKSLVQHRWGCHASEDSLKAVMKQLDSRGIREQDLKKRLKESIEDLGSTERHESNEHGNVDDDDHAQEHDDGEMKGIVMTNGDDSYFMTAKDSVDPKDDVLQDILETRNSAIGASVRARIILKESKNLETARYENGVVTGWKLNREKAVDRVDEDVEEEFEGPPKEKVLVEIPIWRVQTERGHTLWLHGQELLQSCARHKKWINGSGYFEHDAAFFSYRNNHGRYCGKSVDAPYASSPSFFAKLMMKREAELYPKLKTRSYDNSWGGQSGARALWTNSMKDYAYDFQTVRQGLLTLENAFFELTGKFSEYGNIQDDESIDGEALLADRKILVEVELESIEKGLAGLWNSPSSRAVFLAIVNGSKTTGILALSLDLLVRNTMKYLQTHKLMNARSSRSSIEVVSAYDDSSSRPVRSTRKMNSWQQQQQLNDDDDDGAGNDDDNSDEDWR